MSEHEINQLRAMGFPIVTHVPGAIPMIECDRCARPLTGHADDCPALLSARALGDKLGMKPPTAPFAARVRILQAHALACNDGALASTCCRALAGDFVAQQVCALLFTAAALSVRCAP
jgi:hypothetical protein